MARRLPADWARMLDQMGAALGQAVRLAEAREAAHDGASSAVCQTQHRQQALERFSGCLVDLQHRTTQAEQTVAHLDRALAEDEDRLRDVLTRAAGIREKLLHWLDRAVG